MPASSRRFSSGAGKERAVEARVEEINACVRELPGLLRRDPDQAIVRAGELLEFAATSDDPTPRAFAHRLRGTALLRIGSVVDALADLRSATAIYRSQLDDRGIAETALPLGRVLSRLGDVADAYGVWREALDRCDEQGLLDLSPRLRAALGGLFTDLGDYPRALSSYLRALDEIQSHGGSQDEIGILLSSIATVYATSGDADGAEEYHRRSLAAFHRSGNRYREAMVRANIAALALEKGEVESGREEGFAALILLEATGDALATATLLLTLAASFQSEGDDETALEHTLRALSSLEQIEPSPLHVRALLRMGQLHDRLGVPDDAVFVYGHSAALAAELDDPDLEAEAHEVLSTLLERLERVDEALEHARSVGRLREESARRERSRQVELLEARHELELLERDREGARGATRRLEEELRALQGELAKTTMSLVEKNQLIESLRRSLMEIHRQGGEHGPQLAEVIRELGASVEEHEAVGAIEAQFQNVHRDFLQRVSSLYPDLTPTELKVCALIRLNMPSKEIAATLHMSERTVESHRYWIRKKLRLNGTNNLGSFMAGL